MRIAKIPEEKLCHAVDQLRSLYEDIQNEPEFKDMFNAKDQVIGRYQKIFSPEHLPKLTKEEFLGFLKFENNQHWTPLYRQQKIITSDMDSLRKALLNLVDEYVSIKDSLDNLRPLGKAPWIKGLSKAIITPILLIMFPEKYGVWNGTSEAGMKTLGVWPPVKTTTPFSEKYLAINEVLLELSKRLKLDLWTLDGLWWGVRRLEEPDLRPLPTIQNESTQIVSEPIIGFGMESHLQEFLFDNWDQVDALREWELFTEEDEIVGKEYFTEIGRIDLLAKHKNKPKWLVIELKRNQASDTTMGQVNRYMGWVKANLAKQEDYIHGLIIAKEMTEQLKFALVANDNIKFMSYLIDFQLVNPSGNKGKEL